MRVAMLGNNYRYAFAPYLRGDSEQPYTTVDAMADSMARSEKQRRYENVMKGIPVIGDTLANVAAALIQKNPQDGEKRLANISWFERNQSWVIAGVGIIGAGVLIAAVGRKRRRRRR